MENGRTFRSQLSWLLGQEIMGLESLSALLREESHLLLARDPARLEQLIEAKTLQVSELVSLDERRETLFREAGLNGEKQKMGQMLDEHFAGTDLADLWRRLLSLAEECQQLNRLNAATLEIGQQHLSRALQVLRGTVTEDELYNPHGEKSPLDARRLLGQA